MRAHAVRLSRRRPDDLTVRAGHFDLARDRDALELRVVGPGPQLRSALVVHRLEPGLCVVHRRQVGEVRVAFARGVARPEVTAKARPELAGVEVLLEEHLQSRRRGADDTETRLHTGSYVAGERDPSDVICLVEDDLDVVESGDGAEAGSGGSDERKGAMWDIQNSNPKQNPQGDFLAYGHLQLVEECHGHQGNHEVLDNSDGDVEEVVKRLVIADVVPAGLVRDVPLKVDLVPKRIERAAAEKRGHGKRDERENYKGNGPPQHPVKCGRDSPAAEAPVEEENADLGEARGDSVLKVIGEDDLSCDDCFFGREIPHVSVEPPVTERCASEQNVGHDK